MKSAAIIIACAATLIFVYATGYEQASREYEIIISKINELTEVRDSAHEENCNVRIMTILDRIDLKCLGEWSAADGEVTLYPDWQKEAAE